MILDEFLRIYNLDKKSLNDNKNYFRYICYCYIDNFRKLVLPKVHINLDKEFVIVEFRNYPHIEFLLRNAILKLNQDSSWSFSIVCGNLNYDLIQNIVKTIDRRVKIIQLDFIDNLSQTEYSELLTTKYFWNLFNGEKLLITQEDSYIFNSNIDNFLYFDYVGAPWLPHQNDTPNKVGNGGFSLRSKSVMLKVIERISPVETEYNTSTKNYMNGVNLSFPPEDVYFSLNIQKYKLGKVPKAEVASLFSTERIYNKNSFGGHCFWLSNLKNWKNDLQENIEHSIKLFSNKFIENKYDNIIVLSEIEYNLKHLFLKLNIVDTPFDYISNKQIKNMLSVVQNNFKIEDTDFEYSDEKKCIVNNKYEFVYNYKHDKIELKQLVIKYKIKYNRLKNLIRNKSTKLFILIENNHNKEKFEDICKFLDYLNKINCICTIIFFSSIDYDFENVFENKYDSIQFFSKTIKIKNRNKYKKEIFNILNEILF